MIYVKSFVGPKGTVLAMCDEEIMGRVLKEGKIEIDLNLYGGFYKGELMTEIEAAALVDGKVYSANVVGNRAVGILVKKGLADEADVKRIQGVRYVQIFRVD